MSKYALLFHQVNPESGRRDHYDLLVEPPTVDGVAPPNLQTWELPSPPAPGRYPVRRLPDHRYRYLSWEGELSDDRGTVSRVAYGEVIWQRFTKNHFKFSIRNDTGYWNLTFTTIDSEVWELVIETGR